MATPSNYSELLDGYRAKRSDEEAIAALATVPGEFASDLYEKHHSWGLRPKQLYWAHLLADEALTPSKRVHVNLAGVMELFEKGARKLKYPKIRFTTENGDRVVLSRAGARSRKPGTINVTDGGPFGDNVWYGRIELNGTYEPSRQSTGEISDFLQSLSDDAVEVAKVYGKSTHECMFCGKDLTDDRSRHVGYGPTCAKNWGLPWGK